MDQIEVKEASIDEAKKEIDKQTSTFLDIRDEESYKLGHIPGAIHISDNNLEEYIQQADKSHPTIICCYHGNTSFGAAAFFMEKGFQNVRSLSGGFEMWKQTQPSEISE